MTAYLNPAEIACAAAEQDAEWGGVAGGGRRSDVGESNTARNGGTPQPLSGESAATGSLGGPSNHYEGGHPVADILTPPADDSRDPRRSPWSCRCGRRWSSLTQAHCMGCHEHFASVGVSDHHQTDGVCTYPAEVRKKNGTPVYRLSREAEGDVWRSFQRRDKDTLPAGDAA